MKDKLICYKIQPMGNKEAHIYIVRMKSCIFRSHSSFNETATKLNETRKIVQIVTK